MLATLSCLLKSQIQTNVFSKLASLEQPLFNDWLRGWEVGQAAALKSTVRAQNTIKLNGARIDSFFYFFFIADFFWCLRRSGFVVGARENGLGARPNFLYAGKTLYSSATDRGYMDSNNCLSRTEIALS